MNDDNQFPRLNGPFPADTIGNIIHTSPQIVKAEVVKDFDDVLESFKHQDSLTNSFAELGYPWLTQSEIRYAIHKARNLEPGTVFMVDTKQHGQIFFTVSGAGFLTKPQTYIRTLETVIITQQEFIDSQLKSLTFKALFALMFNKLTILFRKGPSNGK